MRNVLSIAAAALAGAVLVGGAVAVQTTPAEAGASTGTWKYGAPYRGYRGGYAYRGGYGYRPYRRYGGGAVAAGGPAWRLAPSAPRRRPPTMAIRPTAPPRSMAATATSSTGAATMPGVIRSFSASRSATDAPSPRSAPKEPAPGGLFLVWVFRFLQNFRKLRAEGWGAARCCGHGPRKPCPVHAAAGFLFPPPRFAEPSRTLSCWRRPDGCVAPSQRPAKAPPDRPRRTRGAFSLPSSTYVNEARSGLRENREVRTDPWRSPALQPPPCRTLSAGLAKLPSRDRRTFFRRSPAPPYTFTPDLRFAS